MFRPVPARSRTAAPALFDPRSYVEYRQLNINLRVEMRVRSFSLLFIVANNLAQVRRG